MTRLILVRHGETEWNRLRRVQGGNSNTPLNETGKQQAECLGLRLKSEPIQAIYSSPLERAVDTAQAIAGHHQLDVTLEPDLREFDLGELEGIKTEDLMSKSFREILITNRQGEILPRVPGGESLAEVQQRAWSAVQQAISQHPDGVIVVVSHYFALSTIVCTALNLPLPEMERLRLHGGSVSTLLFDGQVPRLVLFNDTSHLKTS